MSTKTYTDERLEDIEAERDAAIADINDSYDQKISEAEGFYKGQQDIVEDWSKTQSELQQAQTDFTIQQINQQKDQAEKDYTKEQSAAYVDWQKQSDKYGVNAEKMAANGLQNSGYSESSQVSMYNAHQNRVAVARETISKARIEYDNAMTTARMQNSVALAQIAAETYQKKLEIALAGFQYKNTLLSEMENKIEYKNQVYDQKYKEVLDQIEMENALAELNIGNQTVLLESLTGGHDTTAIRGGDEIKKGVNSKERKKELTQRAATVTFRSPDQVSKFLRDNGLSAKGISIPTREAWNANKKNGNEDSAYEYDTYNDYLSGIVAWIISES